MGEASPSQRVVSDAPVIVGDASRLREDTGWTPSVDFEQTVRDAVTAAVDGA